MLNVKIIEEVVKSTEGQVQLKVEVKQGQTLAAILREVAPQAYEAYEHALRTGQYLMESSEAEWKLRFLGEDSVESYATLLAVWPGEAIVQDRWLLRSRLHASIHAELYVVTPYLSLAALPTSTKNGYVLPCGVTLQCGAFNRFDIAKLATLFPVSPAPDSWMQAATIFFLLGDESTSAVSALYALQDRFSKEMATLRDKISEEIRQADVTIVDCEAIWQYFRGQFEDYVHQYNEGRMAKIREGLPL